jgi:nicotinamide-nucleotide amidase
MNRDTARLELLARRIGRKLLARRQRIATAESCTGGWIAKAITDVAGSSAWFDEGYVTYSNAAKTRTLGVKKSTLAKHGAVSEAVVREMAVGALEAAGADHAVAVSGVAGPDGGTPEKPVGTVWFCWAQRRGRGVRIRTKCRRFPGSRDTVRVRSAIVALAGILGGAPGA